MKKCKTCGGSFKFSTVEYTIETRHITKPCIEIENLPVLKCNICGQTEITDQGYKLIEQLENKLQKEMEEMLEKIVINDNKFSIKKIFQKWIS